MAATELLPLAIPPVRPSFSTLRLSRACGGACARGGGSAGIFGGSGSRLGSAAAEVSGFDGVAHEHGDGHGTDAARNRSESAGGVDGIGMDVADQDGAFGFEFFKTLREIFEEAFGFGGVGDPIGADVDHRSTGLDPVGCDVASFAHGGYDDIGPTDDVREVASFGMAHRDGGVGVQEQQSHGFADDVAAAEDHGVCSFDSYLVAAENFHATGGGAGDQAGAIADELAQVDGMKTIDVFGGIDRFEDALGVHLFGEG